MEKIAATLQIGLIRLTRLAIVLLSAVFVLIIIYAVASRYLLGFSLVWIEEVARFLLAWIVFLGISVALYERGHMAMIAIHRKLPFRTKKLLDAVFGLFMILFLAVVFYEGLDLALSVIPQISPALEVTYFWPYLSMPVGAALAIVQLLFRLSDDLQQLTKRASLED